MSVNEQIALHTKCIAYDIKTNRLEKVFFHIKGIFRAIFS